MIRKIDHVAIAVRSVEDVLPFYEQTLGLKCTMIKEVPTEGVRVAFIPLGESEIELVQPLDPEGGVAKFIAARGEGVHHICLDVSNIDQEVQTLLDKGAMMLDKQPKQGAVARVAFMHPKGAHGVLIELSERDQ